MGQIKKYSFHLVTEYKSNKKQSKQATTPNKDSKASLSTSATTSSEGHTPEQQKLYDSVTAQGDKIRKLKSEKAAKDVVLAEVQVLKDLKEQYKKLSGREYAAPSSNATKTPASNNKEKSKKKES